MYIVNCTIYIIHYALHMYVVQIHTYFICGYIQIYTHINTQITHTDICHIILTNMHNIIHQHIYIHTLAKSAHITNIYAIQIL